MSQKSQVPLGARRLPVDPYARAMQLKQKGRYSDAVPLLQAIAEQGRGYEVAQLELGRCFYEMSAHVPDRDSAEQQLTQGFAWILYAASSGLGTAQEELVRDYLNGTAVPVDKTEAGKWYFLWRRNPSRMQIGASQFDVALEQRLKAGLSAAQWQEAERRANAWRRE